MNKGPLQTIKKFCLLCYGNVSKEVESCTDDCNLWPFRFGTKKKGEKPLKAINKTCQKCLNEKNVKKCPNNDCLLFSYRFGHNPTRKGVGGQLTRKDG
ncbi:MAG: hypothetical protein ACFFDN_16835 [Candidatus Hodarchaeota archaeon]